ncbi:MAG: hypothetical protein ACKOXB_08875 [Flavobacteriales bacterium]
MKKTLRLLSLYLSITGMLLFSACEKLNTGDNDDDKDDDDDAITVVCSPLKVTIAANGNTTVIDYTYNSTGGSTGQSSTFNGSLTSTNKNYQLDSKGRVLSYDIYDKNNNKTQEISYTYNNDGKILTYTYKSLGVGAFTMVTTYTYNGSGTESGIVVTYNNTTQSTNKNYQHDSKGNVTYYEVYDQSNAKLYEYTKTYNSEGKILTLQAKAFIGNKNTTVNTYTYDSSGRENGNTTTVNGSLFSTVKNYQYDSNGNNTYNETYDKDNVKTSTYSATYNCLNM